eukprot:974513-Prorocentrum_minimum.AAC.1
MGGGWYTCLEWCIMGGGMVYLLGVDATQAGKDPRVVVHDAAVQDFEPLGGLPVVLEVVVHVGDLVHHLHVVGQDGVQLLERHQG